MKIFALVLTFLALPLSHSARAEKIDCAYQVIYSPERVNEVLELNKKGTIQLDTATMGFAQVELPGEASSAKYHVIGKAMQMTNGVQVQFGLYSGVKFEETGFVGRQLAGALVLFGQDQKELSLQSYAPDVILALQCKRL